MSFVFSARSQALERMDIETLSPEDTSSILEALETINVWLGGVRATLWHLKRFSKRWDAGQRIRIVDWGTGGADMPRAIVRWGRAQGFKIEVVGVDNNPAIAAYARKASREFPEISIVETNALFRHPLRPLAGDPSLASERMGSPPESAGNDDMGTFDYAISSLCLHHLSDDQVVGLLQQSDRFASRGILMNDLKRSARAWAWIWALSRLGGADPVVQYDGPLSVKRAFTSEELRNLALKAGIPYTKVHTHFGYRLTLAGEKI